MDPEMRGILVRFLIGFSIAFILVMFLFVRKPHLAKCRNRYVRAAVLFALVFIPGVFAASVCAKSITALQSRFRSDSVGETSEIDETAETEEEREDDRDE